MNFLVFTPCSPASAIGRVAKAIRRELKNSGHGVVTVSTEVDPKPGCGDIIWTDEPKVWEAIEASDITIFHIGDNADFHHGALEWMSRAPGVVCLHDFSLVNLFNGVMARLNRPLVSEMETWYGPEVAKVASDTGGSLDLAIETPMTEWVCSQALGVIAHSQWGIERVAASCPGPIWVVPLGIDERSGACQSDEGGLLATNPTAVEILSLGYANPNRHLDRVISALASSDLLRERVTFSLVGPIHPSTVLSLSSLARAGGVRLRVYGEVDEDSFSRHLGKSDIVVALRWPTLEGASATVIEAMLAGKPVVVARAGFCSELPDDTVVKVDVGAETQQLASELERLVSSADVRRQLGERAKSFALETFRVDSYAASLVSLAEQVLRFAPIIDVERVAFSQLREWGIGNEKADLFVHSALMCLGAKTVEVF